MVEVLAKAEKYVNSEEALLSKRENSSAKRRKAGARKSESGTPEDEETGIDPHEETNRTKNGLQRDEATSRTTWAHLSPSYSIDIHPEIHPLDSLGVIGPT